MCTDAVHGKEPGGISGSDGMAAASRLTGVLYQHTYIILYTLLAVQYMPLCDNIYFSYMTISILLYGILYSSYVILYMLRPIRHPSLSVSRAFCMNMRDASRFLHNYSSSTPRECPCNAQKIFRRRIRGLWAFCVTYCQSVGYAFRCLRMCFSYLRKSLSGMPEEPLRRHG